MEEMSPTNTQSSLLAAPINHLFIIYSVSVPIKTLSKFQFSSSKWQLTSDPCSPADLVSSPTALNPAAAIGRTARPVSSPTLTEATLNADEDETTDAAFR
jgi:hypothetical protein